MRAFRIRRSGVLPLAFAALAILSSALAVPVTVTYGPFDVTFYNNGDNDGFRTSFQDWSAQQQADVGATITTWSSQITNVPVRQVQLRLFWQNLPGASLGQGLIPYNGDGTYAWTRTERVWRDGVDPGLDWDVKITCDIDAAGSAWNFGIGDPAVNQYDFRSMMTHEIGHNVGFGGTYALDDYAVSDKWHEIGITKWDSYLRDDAGNRAAPGGTGNPGNFNELDNPAWFDGPKAVAAYGGNVPVYAPAPRNPSNSLNHLDEALLPNALMSPILNLGEKERAPSDLEWAIMEDMGWKLKTADNPVLTTDPPDKGTLNFGLTRVGTTSNGNLKATNSGTGTLDGTFPAASGVFAPVTTAGFSLGAGASTSRGYSYTPAARGSDSQAVTVTSNGGDSAITLAGQGVGPVFSSSPAPGSTIDFGEVALGGSISLPFDISNISNDPNGGNLALTNLTLIDMMLSGPDASSFSIAGFTPGTVLGELETANLSLTFTGMAPPGTKQATLTVLTDEGAALGVLGHEFVYSLTGAVTPEPTTLGLLGAGLLGVLARRRRRKS